MRFENPNPVPNIVQQTISQPTTAFIPVGPTIGLPGNCKDLLRDVIRALAPLLRGTKRKASNSSLPGNEIPLTKKPALDPESESSNQQVVEISVPPTVAPEPKTDGDPDTIKEAIPETNGLPVNDGKETDNMAEAVPSEPIVEESVPVVENVSSPVPDPPLVEEPVVINLISDDPPVESKDEENSQAPDNVDSNPLFLPSPPSSPEPYASTSYEPVEKVKKPKRFSQPFVEVPSLSPAMRRRFVPVKFLDNFPVVSRSKDKPKETKVPEPLSPEQGEFCTFTT